MLNSTGNLFWRLTLLVFVAITPWGQFRGPLTPGEMRPLPTTGLRSPYPR